MTARPYRVVADGVVLAVKLTPKASRDRVDQVVVDADGQAVLKAQVTAVPEDGKANAALIRMLAKEWRLAKSDFDIVHGATDRRKTLTIRGDGPDLAAHLDEWMAKRS